MNRIYLARTTRTDSKVRVWVVFNETMTVYGRPAETRESLLAHWCHLTKTNPTVMRCPGVMRPSELAMTISALRKSKKDS